MKNFKLIITIAILTAFVYSCNNSAVQRMMEEPVEPERAVGMSDWAGVKDMKWHIGTQEAVDVAKNMDSAWKARDWETMRTFISDTAKITASNGYTFASTDDFIENRKRLDSVMASDGATFDWKFTNLFSVDLNPSTGGEHVHAAFSVSTKTDSTTVNRDVIERYYIIDGKVVTWHQFSLDVK